MCVSGIKAAHGLYKDDYMHNPIVVEVLIFYEDRDIYLLAPREELVDDRLFALEPLQEQSLENYAYEKYMF